MCFVYILKSISSIHIYIGHSDNLQSRLSQHNLGLVKSTKRYLPWEIIYSEQYNTKSEVVNIPVS